jgi:hypothetical protein
MARRTLAARGRTVTLVPTWSGVFGPSMAGPGHAARGGARGSRPTTFEAWLQGQRTG